MRRPWSAALPAVVFAAISPSAVPMAWAQQNVFTPVITVNDATFRSRWAGPQVDESGAIALAPVGEGIRPVEDFATKLREGLHIGSLRFRPGLSVGWDYSDRNAEGGATTGVQNDQSFYIAPTLGLEYARDTGPWSLAASYGGAYTYFINQNYSASGTGSARNPFNNTASFGLRHSGQRHSAQFNGGGSYGNGENIQANGFTTTFVGAATVSYDYLINDFLTTGAYGSYNAQITRYEENDQNGSDLTTTRAGAYIDWLATGKTTAGIRVEAGRLTSQIVEETVAFPAPTPAPAPSPAALGASPTPTPAPTPEAIQPENEVQARQYAQVLAAVAHNLTAKVLVVGGLGASYTVDENIVDVDSQYTGVRPVYLLGLQFDPSEKTSLRAYTSFQGADVVPSYGLSLTWRPRLNTSITLSAYQTQNFSITSIDQFQVNRGFVLSLQQILFSKLTVGLSGGWQQTESISLSSAVESAEPTEYAFAAARVSWRLNSWASWVATVRASTGNQAEPVNSLSFPETTASVGFNLLF
jgi:hypothetical protein